MGRHRNELTDSAADIGPDTDSNELSVGRVNYVEVIDTANTNYEAAKQNDQ